MDDWSGNAGLHCYKKNQKKKNCCSFELYYNPEKKVLKDHVTSELMAAENPVLSSKEWVMFYNVLK